MIKPEKPDQNNHIESFNARFGDKWLIEHRFTNLHP
ncbi:transposase [Halomonas sp. A40-4]|nr:transposase [Halomonas sp. A40-4]